MVIRVPQGDDQQSRVDECENFIIRDIVVTKHNSCSTCTRATDLQLSLGRVAMLLISTQSDKAVEPCTGI